MWKVLSTIVKLILGVGVLVGIIYLPDDIAGLPETYPILKRIVEVPRETLLIWFSVILVIYLVVVELRPYVKALRVKRHWIQYPAAAQMIYEEYKSSDMVIGLIKESNHPRPVEDVMSSWIQDGVERGFISIRGRLEYSNTVENIPADITIETGLLYKSTEGKDVDEVGARSKDKSKDWHGLEIKRSSILSYLADLEADTVERNRVAALK